MTLHQEIKTLVADYKRLLKQNEEMRQFIDRMKTVEPAPVRVPKGLEFREGKRAKFKRKRKR